MKIKLKNMELTVIDEFSIGHLLEMQKIQDNPEDIESIVNLLNTIVCSPKERILDITLSQLGIILKELLEANKPDITDIKKKL